MGNFGRQFGACAAAFLLFAGLAGACGDSKLPGRAREKAQLVLDKGSTVRIGEAMAASLILPKNTTFETGTMARSGCSPFYFKVEPETGWHDPWGDWYYSGIPKHASTLDRPYQNSCGVSAGTAIRLADGKIFQQPPPPPQIGFLLNSWLEFDKPGKYTISLTYQAKLPNGQSEIWDEDVPDTFVTLQTDPIAIEVLPAAVGGSGPTVKEIAAGLSYLSGPDPALVNSPDQQSVADALEAQLRDPKSSISVEFLDLLAFTKTRLQHPELFGGRIRNQWTKQWEADSKLRNLAYLRNMSEYTRELLSAIPMKDENAQSESLDTVRRLLAHWPLTNKEAIRKPALRESALLLSRMRKPPPVPDDQWRQIASPAMVPFLMRALKEGRGFGEETRTRLYEIAPLRVERLMVEAMQEGEWRLALSWGRVVQPTARLSRLVDDYGIHVLTNDKDYDNSDVEWMLLKFGTRTAAGGVRRILASQDCFGDPVLWAFLLKVDGAKVEPSMIRRYRTASLTPSCRADSSILKVVDAVDSTRERTWPPYWSPVLEKTMTSLLEKKDMATVYQAAEFLGLYGSKDAEDKLWAKLEAWHRSPPTASGKDADLSNMETPASVEEVIEGALLGRRSWATHNQMGRLWSLCTYNCDLMKMKRSQAHAHRLGPLDRYIQTAYIDYTSDLSFSTYVLREWLQRFPPGTKFAILGWHYEEIPVAEVRDQDPELWQLLKKMKFEVVGPPQGFDEDGRCRQSKPS